LERGGCFSPPKCQ